MSVMDLGSKNNPKGRSTPYLRTSGRGSGHEVNAVAQYPGRYERL